MKKIKIGDCFYPHSTSQDAMALTHIDPIGYACLAKNGGMSNQFYISKVVPIPTLHLPIGNDAKKYGGAWFDMIRSGVKKEEYREIWGQNETGRNIPIFVDIPAKIAFACYGEIDDDSKFLDFLRFHMKKMQPKVLHLTNGYGHDKPQLWVHIESISIGRGNPEWGAPLHHDVFIIRLGDVFHTKNLK